MGRYTGLSYSQIVAKYKQERREYEELKIKRASKTITQIMNTDQFKMSVLATPDAKIAVNALLEDTVRQVVSSTSDYEDTLRARGFKPAEIHYITRILYETYFGKINSNGSVEVDDSIPYERMLQQVADYAYQHQEVYTSLVPEEWRARMQNS